MGNKTSNNVKAKILLVLLFGIIVATNAHAIGPGSTDGILLESCDTNNGWVLATSDENSVLVDKNVGPSLFTEGLNSCWISAASAKTAKATGKVDKQYTAFSLADYNYLTLDIYVADTKDGFPLPKVSDNNKGDAITLTMGEYGDDGNKLNYKIPQNALRANQWTEITIPLWRTNAYYQDGTDPTITARSYITRLGFYWHEKNGGSDNNFYVDNIRATNNRFMYTYSDAANSSGRIAYTSTKMDFNINGAGTVKGFYDLENNSQWFTQENNNNNIYLIGYNNINIRLREFDANQFSLYTEGDYNVIRMEWWDINSTDGNLMDLNRFFRFSDGNKTMETYYTVKNKSNADYNIIDFREEATFEFPNKQYYIVYPSDYGGFIQFWKDQYSKPQGTGLGERFLGFWDTATNSSMLVFDSNTDPMYSLLLTTQNGNPPNNLKIYTHDYYWLLPQHTYSTNKRVFQFLNGGYKQIIDAYATWAYKQPFFTNTTTKAQKIAAKPNITKMFLTGAELKQGTSFTAMQSYANTIKSLYGLSGGWLRPTGWQGDGTYDDYYNCPWLTSGITNPKGTFADFNTYLEWAVANGFLVTPHDNFDMWDYRCPDYNDDKEYVWNSAATGLANFDDMNATWGSGHDVYVSPWQVISKTTSNFRALKLLGVNGIFYDTTMNSNRTGINLVDGADKWLGSANMDGKRAVIDSITAIDPTTVLGSENFSERMMDKFDYAEGRARLTADTNYRNAAIPIREYLYSDKVFFLPHLGESCLDETGTESGISVRPLAIVGGDLCKYEINGGLTHSDANILTGMVWHFRKALQEDSDRAYLFSTAKMTDLNMFDYNFDTTPRDNNDCSYPAYKIRTDWNSLNGDYTLYAIANFKDYYLDNMEGTQPSRFSQDSGGDSVSYMTTAKAHSGKWSREIDVQGNIAGTTNRMYYYIGGSDLNANLYDANQLEFWFYTDTTADNFRVDGCASANCGNLDRWNGAAGVDFTTQLTAGQWKKVTIDLETLGYKTNNLRSLFWYIDKPGLPAGTNKFYLDDIQFIYPTDRANRIQTQTAAKVYDLFTQAWTCATACNAFDFNVSFAEAKVFVTSNFSNAPYTLTEGNEYSTLTNTSGTQIDRFVPVWVQSNNGTTIAIDSNLTQDINAVITFNIPTYLQCGRIKALHYSSQTGKYGNEAITNITCNETTDKITLTLNGIEPGSGSNDITIELTGLQISLDKNFDWFLLATQVIGAITIIGLLYIGIQSGDIETIIKLTILAIIIFVVLSLGMSFLASM
jgi:hypothetical protein